MTYPESAYAVLTLLGVVILSATVGYLVGRTRTRREVQADRRLHDEAIAHLSQWARTRESFTIRPDQPSARNDGGQSWI